MKKIDYSFEGGMPFVQDVLEWAHNGYKDAIAALAKMIVKPGNADPVIVTGCDYSAGGGGSYSAGWLFFDDELIYFPGGAVPVGGAIIGIANYTTSVAFEDDELRPIYVERKADYNAVGPYNLGSLQRSPVNILTTGWVNAGTPVFTGLGGTVAVEPGDASYSHYKVIGNTLFMQIRVRSATISGSPSGITIDLPTALTSAGLKFKNLSFAAQVGFYNDAPAIKVATTSDGLKLTLNLTAGGNFTNGTDNQGFDISVFGEIGT